MIFYKIYTRYLLQISLHLKGKVLTFDRLQRADSFFVRAYAISVFE
jgi:hypothetical protein